MRMHFEAVARTDDLKGLVVAGLDAVAAAGLQSLFSQATIGDKTFSGSWSTLRPKLKPRDGDDVEVRSASDEDLEAELDFVVSDDFVKVILETDVDNDVADLDAIEKFMTSLYDAVPAARWSRGYVKITGLAYPRPRPPKADDQWPLGHLVDFVDEKFHLSDDEDARPEQMKIVATSSLPEGASRRRHGKLVIVRWLPKYTGTDAAKEAQSQQERWFSSVLELPRDEQFNADGDMKVTVGFTEPAPPLTLYRSGGSGFKAVVPAKGKLQSEDVKLIKSLLRGKKLKDGRPVKAITLIVPRREDALAVVEQAKDTGCDRVIYADAKTKGVFWDPFPPGDWE